MSKENISHSLKKDNRITFIVSEELTRLEATLPVLEKTHLANKWLQENFPLGYIPEDVLEAHRMGKLRITKANPAS
ncbi:MAG: hypothetical protein P0Y53_17095 [Candidatus Pseudobacter hemicellulosilyticus]|uniref:Uncharacterized protein n=1 Tax=Candidatus Pseudobacter hemicellulosilyticus TaxID=3121375 RepID=A0AAJ6BGJ6_9BACT|nr:MAG: hypothetical protein P0Y53_17095 [Pseudobacter sp.]